MTDTELFRALGGLDEDLILQAAPDATPEPHGRPRVRFKAIALAASLLLTFGIGIGIGGILIPALNEPTVTGETPSRIHVVWMDGILYFPFFFGTDAYCEKRYPEMFTLDAATGEMRPITLTAAHLGAPIGELAADEYFDLPAGHAYRFALCPDDASIFVAERDGSYSFYISSGDTINQNAPTPASLAFFIHGLPESCLSIRRLEASEGEITDRAVLDEILGILKGKQAADPAIVLRAQWEAWYALHGEHTTLTFDGKLVSETGASEMKAFMEFSNQKLHMLVMTTSRGFRDISFWFDTDYGYITFCGNQYLLSEAETARITELLGLTTS